MEVLYMGNEALLKRVTNEQIRAANSGVLYAVPTFTCPHCGSHNVDGYEDRNHIFNYWNCTCKDCGHKWTW